jgi:hypothetical protein
MGGQPHRLKDDELRADFPPTLRVLWKRRQSPSRVVGDRHAPFNLIVLTSATSGDAADKLEFFSAFATTPPRFPVDWTKLQYSNIAIQSSREAEHRSSELGRPKAALGEIV